MAESLNVNFFKPHSPHAKEDMRTILCLFIIWAVGVFGFQFLLVALNEDTPEPAYTQHETLWPKVQNLEASVVDKQAYAKVILAVLGKNIALSPYPEHKLALQESLSALSFNLLGDADKKLVRSTLDAAAKGNGSISPAVVAVAKALGLGGSGFDKVMRDLLPTSLIVPKAKALSPALPEIMKKYLVHNQNALTDFKFIGFPFHYWYTAQFLLIMFVGLCLIYAYRIDRINKKHNFEDK